MTAGVLRSAGGRIRADGFTLIELLVTISIAAILLAIAVPGLRGFLRDSEMSAATNRLVGDLNYARTEASARRVQITLCRSANSTASTPSCTDSGGWEQGWIVFVDTHSDGDYSATDDVLIRQSEKERSNITIRGRSELAGAVSFSGIGLRRGVIPESDQIVLCNEKAFADGGKFARVIYMTVAGRVQASPGDRNSAPTPVTTCTPT